MENNLNFTHISKVGYTYDDFMLKHFQSQSNHSECPERISSIYENLKEKNLLSQVIIL